MYLKRLVTYSLLSLVALGGFFGNIQINTQKDNKNTIVISYEGNRTYAITDEGTNLFAADAARYEADKAKNTTSSADQLKMWNSVIDALNIILGIITAIVSPAIMFAGWLMSPDWTSGDLFGLRTPMYSLWVTVSNIVYFVYAVLLILIALGTMFGKESFSYKVMLPKLALGILMVPFTWWFVQWTISLASVVTASVITIPAETMKSAEGKAWADIPSIPTIITIDEYNSTPTTKQPIVTCDKPESHCISPTVFLTKASGMYGYMMVYAYSVFKFDQVKELKSGTDMIKAGVGIVHQGIIAAIMFLVFGLLTLALVAMLLVRAIKLWIYAIFSPLFTFQFVAGASMMGGDKDTFTIKEFVGLAFVPAIVGLSLSFGLILINAVSSSTPGTNQNTCTVDMLKTEKGCILLSLMGSTENTVSRRIDDQTDPQNPRTQNIVKFGGITMTFNGVAGSGKDGAIVEGSTNTITGVLNSSGGVFGTLIIDIIALVFIWMAFMAAKNVSKAVSMAVEPFEKIGQQVGSLAKSIPKYTPIPGIGMSANSIAKVPQGLESALVTKSDKDFKNSGTGQWLESLNPGASAEVAELTRFRQAAQKESTLATNELRQVSLEMQAAGRGITIARSLEIQEQIKIIRNKVKDGKITKENFKDSGYDSIEAAKIIELFKDDKFDENKEKIAALLAGGKISHATTRDTAERFLKQAKTTESGTARAGASTTSPPAGAAPTGSTAGAAPVPPAGVSPTPPPVPPAH